MQDEPHRLSRLAEDLISSLRKIPSEDPKGIRRKPSMGVAEVIDALKAKYGIGVPRLNRPFGTSGLRSSVRPMPHTRTP